MLYRNLIVNLNRGVKCTSGILRESGRNAAHLFRRRRRRSLRFRPRRRPSVVTSPAPGPSRNRRDGEYESDRRTDAKERLSARPLSLCLPSRLTIGFREAC